MFSTYSRWTIAALLTLTLGCANDFHWQSQNVAMIGTAGNLVVTENTHYHQASGNLTQPFDFSTAPVTVLVLDGTGNFTSVPGTPMSDGGLSFNVGAGIYYVQQGTAYAVTSLHNMDLSTNTLGRPNVPTSGNSQASANLNVWSVTPWTTNYTDPPFELTVPAVGDNGQLSLNTVPTPGQNQLTNAGATYFDSVGNVPAFDPTSGDPSYLNEFQLVNLNALLADGGVKPVQGSTVVASSQVAGLALAPDAGALSIAATLQPTVMDQLVISWPRSIYADLSSEFGDGAQILFTSFGLSPVAYGFVGNSWVGYSGSLFNLFPDDSTIEDLNDLEIAYGNPYPATWGVAASATAEYQRLLPGIGVAGASPDGGTVPDYRLLTFYTQTNPVASLATDSMGMVLTPPSALTVNGAPTGDFETISMTNVTLGWSPPTVGTANGYRVSIREVTADSSLGFVRYINTVLATFSTAGDTTQLVIPPGLFQSGHTYNFRVTSLQVSLAHFDTSPRLDNDRLPQAAAQIGSGLVTAL